MPDTLSHRQKDEIARLEAEIRVGDMVKRLGSHHQFKVMAIVGGWAMLEAPEMPFVWSVKMLRKEVSDGNGD